MELIRYCYLYHSYIGKGYWLEFPWWEIRSVWTNKVFGDVYFDHNDELRAATMLEF